MRLLTTAITAAALCVGGAQAQHCGSYGHHSGHGYGFSHGHGHRTYRYPAHGGYNYRWSHAYPRYGFHFSFGGDSHYGQDYRFFRRQGHSRDEARYLARHHGFRFGGRGHRGHH